MRKLVIAAIMIAMMAVPVSAQEWTAPTVPESAQEWMPDGTESFSDGLVEILSKVLPKLQPSLTEAVGTCVRVMGIVLLVSLVGQLHGAVIRAVEVVGAVSIGIVLLQASHSLIGLGVETLHQMRDYGMLLLPVMTSSMAASGGATSSAALYLGTAFFHALLGTAVSVVLVPLLYIFLALAVANSALGEDVLKQMKNLVKWLVTWFLKIVLYVFTGYMGITGVISGSTDAAALKAAKLTISGMVPVVGNILSDASEAVLVGADVVRNAVGIYGLFAILAIWISPFLQIGIQYLLLKLTAAVCGIYGGKATVQLVSDFTAAMGLLLAMTGTVCLMLLISTVCFMKGVG